jgi:hypothetical protein
MFALHHAEAWLRPAIEKVCIGCEMGDTTAREVGGNLGKSGVNQLYVTEGAYQVILLNVPSIVPGEKKVESFQ